ncbi:hypothetical protein LDENG_00121570, partial [Lucifuga dentata]
QRELPFHPSKTHDSIRFTNYWSEFHSSTGQRSKTFIRMMPKLHPLKREARGFRILIGQRRLL